jgi:hypothetical protein
MLCVAHCQRTSANNRNQGRTLTRTAAIGIRVEPEIKAAAEKAAKEDRRTVASLVEKVLVEHLENAGYLKKPKAR